MKRAIVLFSVSVWLCSTNALAMLPVHDLPGWTAKFVSIYKQIEELNILKNRVTYEIESTTRLYNKLKKWKTGDISNISSIISHINSFRSRARSIGYAYDGIADQFEKVYGSKGSYKKNYKAWEKQSDDSVREAMVSQGLLENSKSHMDDLDKIVKEKREDQDPGATLQAIGEINAIQSKQLANLSEIIATDARAKQSLAMEDRAKQKDQQNYENHLMKDFNKPQKSHPLTHFPSLGTTAPRR